MGQTDDDKKGKKEAMKKLRNERKQFIKAAAARMKEQKKVIKAIKEQIKDNPGTVPEIAEGTGIQSSEVLWYLATLKKFGQIMEGEKDGAYFRYELVETEQEEAAETEEGI
ncbi:MAG: winged helix-turn-helix domain-containing protein [Deltaproteobacteria bacterium]|nr:winged helix-turn-helix domain-containing protein [Deltaproteobacteria bacterium]MBW2117128.1 winged helix-turn-helix domain-containing protein [Deltaproteobacteria bacterium]MBW2342743.1 winged helix-turn-helix domain-containing protein [Deltaproteobacteria bacterium]